MDMETIMQLLPLLIPLVTPLLTAGIKKVTPKIPKLGVVILQPVLGAFLGALSLGDPVSGAGIGAGLGLAGIGVRETVDQTKKAGKKKKKG